jgi:hypothetical protein
MGGRGAQCNAAISVRAAAIVGMLKERNGWLFRHHVSSPHDFGGGQGLHNEVTGPAVV